MAASTDANALSEPLLPAEGEDEEGDASRGRVRFADEGAEVRLPHRPHTVSAGSGFRRRMRTLSGSAPLPECLAARVEAAADSAATAATPGDGQVGVLRKGDAGGGGGDGGDASSSGVGAPSADDAPRVKERTVVARWCYAALEGGFSPVPLAWYFPHTNRFMSSPMWMAVFFLFAVAFPMIGLMVHAYLDVPLAQCGDKVCHNPPNVTIQFTQCNVNPAIPEGNIPVLAVCNYILPTVRNNSTEPQVPLPSCPLISGTGTELMYETNSSYKFVDVRGNYSDPQSYTDNTHVPSRICAYQCDHNTCPGYYSLWGLGTGTALLICAALSSLRLMWVFLVQRPYIEPLSIAGLIKKLVSGLPAGTFMVSYSWSARDGEQCSQATVGKIASIMPCCWWDREQLLPGASVTEMCTQAATNCTYAFVFVSQNYMRSGICQTELAVLRQKRGRVLAAVHSDVADTKAGQDLMIELREEGHRVWVVRPAEVHDVGFVAASANFVNARMVLPALRAVGHAVDGGDPMVFDVGGGAWVGPVEFLWIVLCIVVFRDAFTVRSPPLNAASWKITAAVLRGSHAYLKRTMFTLYAMFWAVAVIITVEVWRTHDKDPALYYGSIVLSLMWSWGLLVRGSRMAYVKHICGQSLTANSEGYGDAATGSRAAPGGVASSGNGAAVDDDDDDDGYNDSDEALGGVASDGSRIAPKEKCMPPSGALLTILHRIGVVGTNLPGSYSTCVPAWPLPKTIVPPPTPVDIGEGVPPRRFAPLVAAGLITVVPLRSAAARVRLVRLEAGLPHVEVDDTIVELYWSACGFGDLHPDTQSTFGNRIVLVNTPKGPALETVIIQIIMTQLNTNSSRLWAGSGRTKWRSKTLRAR